jgi:glycerol-3-phosphate dehydrogenase subunit C
MSRVPARAPSRPPAFDVNETRYWNERDLEDELVRTFQVCQDCRMCVTYCGSFPLLFDAVDREIEAGRAHGAENVSTQTIQAVVDHCWQCKLCYIKCPYTADEGAYELLDFPRLMAREKAVRARRDGIPLVDRLLGEPDVVGALGSGPPARVANLVNANRLVRRVAESVTGISAEFPLPTFAEERFTSWFADHEPLSEAGGAGEVVLFSTCYGEHNFPEVPRAAVLALEKNGYSVVVSRELACCGMPNLDGGDVDQAKRKMQRNVEHLLPLLREGRKLVVVGPTCGYTIKKEWPAYLGTSEAGEVAAATLDLMEFFDRLRQKGQLNKNFDKGFGKLAYHAACHLRAQKIAIPGARVLAQTPGTEVRIVERCSAVDGTWGMKAAFYAEGERYAARLGSELERGREAGEVGVVTDCSLAALRVKKQLGQQPRHPVELLAEAYGLGAERPAL